MIVVASRQLDDVLPDHSLVRRVGSLAYAVTQHDYERLGLSDIADKARRLSELKRASRFLGLEHLRAAQKEIPAVAMLMHDRDRLDFLSEAAGCEIEPYPITTAAAHINFYRPTRTSIAFHTDGPAIVELIPLYLEGRRSAGCTILYTGTPDEAEIELQSDGDDRTLMASIELGLKNDPDVEFVSWQEIINKAPPKTRNAKNPFAIPVTLSYTYPKTGNTHTSKKPLIPDGLFGLRYTKTNTYRFFALEAERRNRVFCSNLQQTSGLRKVLCYRQIARDKVYQSHLGLPNLMVMFITPNKQKIETYSTLIMEITGTKGNTMFLFRDIPVAGYSYEKPVPLPSLYADPWQRVGNDDFYINQS